MLLNPPLLRHQQTYEDAGQVQSRMPVWDQPGIPAGIHNIQLSWDRKARPDGAYMRIILPDLSDNPDERIPHPHHHWGWVKPNTWWFKEYLGQAQVLGTDNSEGRILMCAMARINNETLTLYRAPDATPHSMVPDQDIKERLEPTYNRLCYRRELNDWRVRDERKAWQDATALKFVVGYVGDLSAEKNQDDPYGHIFHRGTGVIDTDNILHLYSDSVVYE